MFSVSNLRKKRKLEKILLSILCLLTGLKVLFFFQFFKIHFKEKMLVARDFAVRSPDDFSILCETDLDWKYFDPNKSHLHCLAPVIVMEKVKIFFLHFFLFFSLFFKNDARKIKQIRWNHYDRGDLRHLLQNKG